MTWTWQFFVTFLGWLSYPFKGLSDLQLEDEKGTLNHLGWIFKISHIDFHPDVFCCFGGCTAWNLTIHFSLWGFGGESPDSKKDGSTHHNTWGRFETWPSISAIAGGEKETVMGVLGGHVESVFFPLLLLCLQIRNTYTVRNYTGYTSKIF